VDVEVVRSTKRRKTVQARMVGGVLRVSIPATMTRSEEAHWVGEMSRRFERRRDAGRIDLETRAAALAARHDLPVPTTIRWVDNQNSRWGSCTPVDGSVRLSSRLATYPEWVVDYVIVHELAHLVEPNHDPRFWELVNRYPRAERARGFLIAKGLDLEHE
jgi:predicted metal-dependent hydrolase